MLKDKVNRKFFLWGGLTGVIIGSFSVFIAYKFNLPVIEKIRYIQVPVESIKTFTENLLPSSDKSNPKTHKSKDTASVKKISTDSNSKLTSKISGDSANIAQNKSSVDTLNLSDNNQGNIQSDNDIVVVKDELILKREIKLANDSRTSNDNNLSAKLTDGNQPVKNNSLLVEFWKSPVNYQGFKMANNKLIIFGIDNLDLVDFIQSDNSVYMFYLNNFYHLDETDNFKPLVKITNSNHINQLKQVPRL